MRKQAMWCIYLIAYSIVMFGVGANRNADMVLKLRTPSSQEIEKIGDRTLVTMLYPRQNGDLVDQLAAQKATCFSMDMLLRTLSRGQAFDVLSSQANIAGALFCGTPPCSACPRHAPLTTNLPRPFALSPALWKASLTQRHLFSALRHHTRLLHAQCMQWNSLLPRTCMEYAVLWLRSRTTRVLMSIATCSPQSD